MIINLYRQPDNVASQHRSTSSDFHSALTAISNVLSSIAPTPDIVFSGDFNLPHVNWKSETSTPGSSANEKYCFESLKTFMNEHFLSQYVVKPTHFKGNTLDLVFTNNTDLVFDYKCVDTLLSTSHHKIVEVSTSFKFGAESSIRETTDDVSVSMPPLSTLNFHDDGIPWKSLEKELSLIDWDREFRKASLDQCITKFNTISYNIALKYVPVRSKFKKKNIPRDRRRLMARRRRLNKRLVLTKSLTLQNKLRRELLDIEKSLQSSYTNSRKFKEEKAVKAIRKNSKYFFSYAKQFSKLKSSVGPFRDGDSIISDNKTMADMLANQFSSVFSVPAEELPSPKVVFDISSNQTNFPCIEDICFNLSDFIEALESLKSSSGAGPDGFPSIYLKNCKSAFAKPLFIIWSLSINSGIIPSCFKTSDIIPLHKKGSLGLPENYRPIANSSHVIKVFEKVLRKFLISYLEENNLMNPNQHGFRQNRSCLSQLLAHYDEVLSCLEGDAGVDVVYLDFSKAFDKVDFHTLLKKLKSLGIRGKIGEWLYAFLTNRTQTVLVNGVRSETMSVISGVPQGSVLGPLLFLIFISDIGENLQHSLLSSFADDTRVFKKISSSQDATDFQADLNSIYLWAENNSMAFNSDKFDLLRYKTPKSLLSAAYKDSDGDDIKESTVISDLGIQMSNDAKFASHINKTVASMKHMSSWVLRSFSSRSRDVMLTTWKSLILPIHDYCSQLWSPSKIGEIQSLELLQWHFLRKIKHVKHDNYWEALENLNMHSLQRRRERYQIIYMWKILENIVPNPYIDSQHSSGTLINFTESSRRGRFCNIPYPSPNTTTAVKNIFYNSFIVHGGKLFNCLPIVIRNLSGCTVEQFKYALDKHLETIPDYPSLPSLRRYCPASSNSLIDIANTI